MVGHSLREGKIKIEIKNHVKFEKNWRKYFGIQPAYGNFFMSMDQNIDQQINLSDKIVLLD